MDTLCFKSDLKRVDDIGMKIYGRSVEIGGERYIQTGVSDEIYGMERGTTVWEIKSGRLRQCSMMELNTVWFVYKDQVDVTRLNHLLVLHYGEILEKNVSIEFMVEHHLVRCFRNDIIRMIDAEIFCIEDMFKGVIECKEDEILFYLLLTREQETLDLLRELKTIDPWVWYTLERMEEPPKDLMDRRRKRRRNPKPITQDELDNVLSTTSINVAEVARRIRATPLDVDLKIKAKPFEGDYRRIFWAIVDRGSHEPLKDIDYFSLMSILDTDEKNNYCMLDAAIYQDPNFLDYLKENEKEIRRSPNFKIHARHFLVNHGIIENQVEITGELEMSILHAQKDIYGVMGCKPIREIVKRRGMKRPLPSS